MRTRFLPLSAHVVVKPLTNGSGTYGKVGAWRHGVRDTTAALLVQADHRGHTEAKQKYNELLNTNEIHYCT